jgi:hypothetical protein
MSDAALDPRTAPAFPMAAGTVMGDSQLRKNVRHATEVIQKKRGLVVGEMPDWQALRESGRRIREHTMQHLDHYLEQFERNCIAARRRSPLGARRFGGPRHRRQPRHGRRRPRGHQDQVHDH